jgi:hypothetical protein
VSHKDQLCQLLILAILDELFGELSLISDDHLPLLLCFSAPQVAVIQSLRPHYMSRLNGARIKPGSAGTRSEQSARDHSLRLSDLLSRELAVLFELLVGTERYLKLCSSRSV